MRLRPFGHRILVDPDEPAGSILARPDSAPEQIAESGVIVAVGSKIMENPDYAYDLQPGVRIAYQPHQVHLHRAKGSRHDFVTVTPAAIDCIIDPDPEAVSYVDLGNVAGALA